MLGLAPTVFRRQSCSPTNSSASTLISGWDRPLPSVKTGFVRPSDNHRRPSCRHYYRFLTRRVICKSLSLRRPSSSCRPYGHTATVIRMISPSTSTQVTMAHGVCARLIELPTSQVQAILDEMHEQSHYDVKVPIINAMLCVAQGSSLLFPLYSLKSKKFFVLIVRGSHCVFSPLSLLRLAEVLCLLL